MKRLVLISIIWALLMTMSYAEDKIIYGYVERATLLRHGLTLPAKMDTGAKSASLYARSIKKIKIKGKNYLEFTVPMDKAAYVFQEPLIGYVKIKARAGEQQIGMNGDVYRRPVVKMAVKVGDRVHKIKINLADRGNFKYPLLLGRDSIIKFNGIIDPRKRYTLNGF